ncbi:MAG TPA: tripartite tricarboxylate transporter substrate binding protein [Burkholderiales bacterium]|nr:tripartite tricarboxylate transporter substrate binding protein [Burkholderiales bacterium]
MRSIVTAISLVAALASSAALAAAQQFPARPVRLVVPYPPGGANDAVVRLLAPKMGEQLGHNVVVDNRGGGNTIIGSELVARAVPDGHTLLIIAAGHAINPALYAKLPYDTVRDFVPIVLIGDGAYVLVVSPALGVSSVPELIKAAKAKPGQIVYASSSTGNLTHLAAEVFNALAGTKMLHVPYKGGGPAMLDLLGGRVSAFFSTVAVARPHLQSGKIRGLGVTTARRSPALPNIPAIAEAGLPGYEVSGWYGLVGPARTPAAVVTRVHAVVQNVTRQPDIKEKLLGLGIDVVEMSPAGFGKRITSDIAKWERIVKPLGITPE